jgi:hypothetical protein
MDGHERTGMWKKIDRWRWGVGHGGRHCCVACARRHRAGRHSGGLSSMSLAVTALGQFGELILPTLRWLWLVRAAGGGDLSSSSLGDGVGVSGVPQKTGKHQWERRTPAILPGRLARCGRQHNGLAAAKMVARVRARLGWGKSLGMAPYIGKLVPTTRK